MDINFLKDNLHCNRYNELVSLGGIRSKDLERMSLFYIISGNEDLYMKKKSIYDFVENAINPECLNSDTVDFCSSSKTLIHLGFNLFNGYSDPTTNPMYIFCGLDTINSFIAYQAIF